MVRKVKGNVFQGGKKTETMDECRALMYDTDCKFDEHCNIECKDTGHCKLFVIRTDEGVVQVKRLDNNA